MKRNESLARWFKSSILQTIVKATNGDESVSCLALLSASALTRGDLVGDQDRHVELRGDLDQLPDVLPQLLLPLRQLPPPAELHAEQAHH